MICHQYYRYYSYTHNLYYWYCSNLLIYYHFLSNTYLLIDSVFYYKNILMILRVELAHKLYVILLYFLGETLFSNIFTLVHDLHMEKNKENSKFFLFRLRITNLTTTVFLQFLWDSTWLTMTWSCEPNHQDANKSLELSFFRRIC